MRPTRQSNASTAPASSAGREQSTSCFGGGHKGLALRDALQVFACHTAIHVGDDATDEDAFATATHHQVRGIRVGAAPGSLARYHLESQSDVDVLLETLAELRMRGRSADLGMTHPRSIASDGIRLLCRAVLRGERQAYPKHRAAPVRRSCADRPAVP
jgi:hypothetical protein